MVSRGHSRAVERLHEEERQGAAARGAHRWREHGAARVTRLDGGGPALRIGQQVEPDHGARGRGLGDDRSDGVVEGSIRGRHELAAALIEDRTVDLLLEGRSLVRRDHRLEGEHVDGRDGRDLAGVGAEAVQLHRAIGRDQPACPRDRRHGALRRPVDEHGGLDGERPLTLACLVLGLLAGDEGGAQPDDDDEGQHDPTPRARAGRGRLGCGRSCLRQDHAVRQPLPKKSVVPDMSSTPRTWSLAPAIRRPPPSSTSRWWVVTSRLRPVESRKSQPDRSTTMSVAPWSMRSSSSRRTAGAVARSRSSSTRTRAVSGSDVLRRGGGRGCGDVVRPGAGRLPVADLAGELAEHPASVLAQVGRRDERQQVALAAEVIQLLEERTEPQHGVDDVGRQLELQVDRGPAGLHRLQELLGLGLGERSVAAGELVAEGLAAGPERRRRRGRAR